MVPPENAFLSLKLCAFLYFVLPIFSASQDQIFGKFLDFQKILEKKLYEIDCNLIKDKLTEQIYINIVAFFDGTHQLVLHRNAECKSSAYVIAWFKHRKNCKCCPCRSLFKGHCEC